MIHSLHAALLLVAWYACTSQAVVTPTLLFHVVPFVIHVFVELPPPIFFQLNFAPNLPFSPGISSCNYTCAFCRCRVERPSPRSTKLAVRELNPSAH